MKKITFKHKFFVSALLLGAAVITTLPYLAQLAINIMTYGAAFALLAAPALLLLAWKMRQLHRLALKQTTLGVIQ